MKYLGYVLSVIGIIATILIFIFTCRGFQEVPEAGRNAVTRALHDAAVEENIGVLTNLIFRTIVGLSLSFIVFFISSKYEDMVEIIKEVKIKVNKEYNDISENVTNPVTRSTNIKPTIVYKEPISLKKDESDRNESVNNVEKQPETVQKAPKTEEVISQKSQIYTVMNSELVNTNKDYVEPIPTDGKSIFWNNHIRGEIVVLDIDVDGVSAKSIGRVLGATKDRHIDVQFENEQGDIKVISVYNNNITVKKD